MPGYLASAQARQTLTFLMPSASKSFMQWPSEAIWEAVSPYLPNFTVEVLPELGSTNTELMRRFRLGQTDPVLLVAERQTSGRGRLGRHWHSDYEKNDSLTFSIGMVLTPQDWSGLSLAVGLSVAQSLHPAIGLKWPNDLWFGQRKLGGILIETATAGALRYAVIGVGLNIRTPKHNALRTKPAGLEEVLLGMAAPAALLHIAPALMQAVSVFEQFGFAPLREAFHARDLLFGKDVVCSDGTTGLARGVDSQGALLVQTPQGVQKINTAEVSVRPAANPLLC